MLECQHPVVAGSVCAQGGVIGVFINWHCNLDLDPSHCKPTYSFRRLDLRKDLGSTGYYYRLAAAPKANLHGCLHLYLLCHFCSDHSGLPNITIRTGRRLGHLSRPMAFD